MLALVGQKAISLLFMKSLSIVRGGNSITNELYNL